ncbi:anthocyanidin 3-O-glucosyltransferase, partial [Trifolium medium]|nr:anthocyanidin 3-O-glucosyltransferase [Trifolium medium]
TGFPFLAALKPPNGFESIEEALPEGFNERIKGKGIVYGKLDLLGESGEVWEKHRVKCSKIIREGDATSQPKTLRQ